MKKEAKKAAQEKTIIKQTIVQTTAEKTPKDKMTLLKVKQEVSATETMNIDSTSFRRRNFQIKINFELKNPPGALRGGFIVLSAILLDQKFFDH